MALFNGIPEALHPYCDIEMNDTRVPVYTGLFSIKCDERMVDVDGIIYYSLYESLKLRFEGKGESQTLSLIDFTAPCQICTANGMTGECILCNSYPDENGKIAIRGKINNLFSIQKECNCWQWLYLNMERFVGESVTRKTEDSVSAATDRLIFVCKDGTQIILENTEKQSNPNNRNQYHISHQCKLTPSNGGKIDFIAALEYIHVFSHFISFVVGRYHSPIFIDGYEDGVHYPFHYSGYDKSLIGVNNWLPFPNDSDIVNLWPIFEEIWNGNDADKADILSTGVHWYLEANMGSGKLEGAIIMAITAVEMFWNVILKKKEKTANNQLQSLLKKMNYYPSFDARSLIDTRNYLTHYDKRNRKKYQRLTREQKIQVLENVLNVLELVILYWLGYKGRYADRTDANKWRGASTKRVPWVITTDKSI